ncbi:MAG: DUF308 domain-containing protein [Enhydrobacter sp.]|nr:DUF308 domain-containing protein [Enhydrobacter sp.]
MSMDEANRNENLDPVAAIRSNWGWFVLLGIALMIAGAIAIILPALSAIAAERILGTVLCLGGLVQVIQASKVANWLGFAWHLLLGLFATIGGALIYIDSLFAVVAITILISAIFAILGVSQIAFALKVRRMAAWHWFLVSGGIALVVSALLLMKLPYSHSFTPATIAGISLLFTGWAYVAIALASKETTR